MPSILYTTSSNSTPQALEGNFSNVSEIRQHLIEKLGVNHVVLTLGSKFRTPLNDSDDLKVHLNKPFNFPVLLHAELI